MDEAQRLQIEAALRESEHRYRTLVTNLPVIVFTTDMRGIITLSEGRGLEALGYQAGQLVGRSVFESFPDLPNICATLQRALDGTPANSIDLIAGRTLETRLTPERDAAGVQVGVSGLTIDITERVESERRLVHLNRLYAVLSRIGETVVGLTSRQALFDAICAIAIEQGAFRGVWVGLHDRDEHVVRPVAWGGISGEYLKSVVIRVDDVPEGQGPTGTAVRERRAVISNDFVNDSRTRPWHAVGAHHGIRSSAAFPLLVRGHVVATLNLYAGEPGFFDSQETALLERVSGVIGFALEKLDEEEHRRRAEAAMRLDSARQEALLRLSEMSSASEREIVQFALEEAVRLTDSKIGYLHFINADQASLQLFTWSHGVRDACYAEETTHYPLEQAGIWVDCIRQRQPIFHNDYQHEPGRKGYPAGHIHVERHLSVPLIDGVLVVAVAGVGNKVEPYTDADARQLLLFMSGMWSLLQRKRTELALRESEARYRRLTEHAPDIIYRYQLQPVPRFEYVSPAATTITGYTPEEHYADPLLGQKLIHPDDRHLLAQLAQGTRLLDEPIELRWVRRDGTVLWVEQRNVAVYDATGALVAIEGIARDITERKQVEQALQAESVRLEAAVAERTVELQRERDRTHAILETLGEAVMMVDMQGAIQYMNPSAVGLTGFTPDHPLARQDGWLWQHVDQELARTRILTAVQAGFVWQGEVLLRRLDGSRYDAVMSVGPLFAPGQSDAPAGFVSAQHDITATKTAERMKDQFVSNVSHELRSPMSLITMLAGSLEMLYHRLDDGRRLEMIGDIRKHARVLNDLIGGVLEISRIDGGRVASDQHELDLVPLVYEAVTQFRPAIQRKALHVTINGDAHVPVIGHAGQLQQVIRNLLSNAVKYTLEDGRIDCTCQVVTSGNGPASGVDGLWPGLSRLSPGAWAALRISDTGIGISAADLPHVFERFFRAETQGDIPGTGLGLPIAWELVKRHGGYLEVASTLHVGSSFVVYLPLAKEPDA